MSIYFFFFKQKTAYEMRISDWSSDVCSSDLGRDGEPGRVEPVVGQLEAAVRLAQDLRRRQPAVVEAEDAVVIAAVRDGVVALADLEAGGAAVDQEIGRASCRERVSQYV